ncbi:chalcone isomerase family protein [Methylohalobius crimeensis]|uniref:chalcone isomerase family protein n=1 Tax=Methylohalobius crimeensis TaxID=244365 RepID=UPI0003B721E6|nr:chalcone isomerase family protein [Methylohalobius crimeensis]
MHSKRFISFILLILIGKTLGAATPWPTRLDYGDHGLVLTGQGEARYLIWHVYDAALYLPAETDEKHVLDEDTPRCLVLRYGREISAEDIRTAADKILDRQADPPTLTRLAPAIETIHRAYRDVAPGDHYRLCHAPGLGTRLYFNDELQAEITLPGFARVYFGIWLGPDEPISESLRQSLLTKRG